MGGKTEQDPQWVFPSWRGSYAPGGLTMLSHFPAAEHEHFGLYPGWPWASLAILFELGGSALVSSGHLFQLRAGRLGAATLVANKVGLCRATLPNP
jgi:uncharacterized membrane protein YphA (DoxX/SURF4 family)